MQKQVRKDANHLINNTQKNKYCFFINKHLKRNFLTYNINKSLKFRKFVKTVCHARESGHPLCKNKRKTDSHFRGNDKSGSFFC
jgi:hypothetical protein